MSTAADDPFSRVDEALAQGGEANAVRQDGRAPGELVMPAPDDSPAPMRRHSQHGVAGKLWTYRDAAGLVLFIVARFDQTAAGKVVLPQTLWRDGDRLHWRWKAPPDPRPLYGLQALAERPSAPVLIVEGEKTADAAQERFPVFVAAWQGGSKAVSKADWTPLAERDVVIWPDADVPGRDAAENVSRRLKALSVDARLVQLPSGLPQSWDLADAWPPGFGPIEAEIAMRAARASEREVYWPRGFRADSTGVWWAPEDNGKGDDVPALWLCGALEVLASARDRTGGDWSTVLQFRDPDGRVKREIVGKGELAGDGIEVRRRLMSAELPVSSNRNARERLQSGLASVSCSVRAHLASSSGWSGPLYVLPHRTIGVAEETVIYRGRIGGTHHSEAGTYADWRDQVAAKASGNAFLLFGLSCAFAGPLLRMLGGEGGGFHIRGYSSFGKTTILRVAGSVWGGGGELGFAQSWRNTDNALEAVALAHNDGLLALDEMRQLDPSATAVAAYALSTGVAKGRLRTDAELKERPSWRVLVLSAGEIGLGDLIRLSRSQDKTYAGQELRLIDLEADIGAGYGAWQALHGKPSAAAFSDRLRSAKDAHYGHAGPMFVERVIGKGRELQDAAERLQAAFLSKVVKPGDTGQVVRAAHRFAAVAVAGELAALLDVTPWRPGEAADGVASIFGRWAAKFGRNVVREDREAVQRVRAFLERYEHSRFRVLKSHLSEAQQLEEELEAQRAAEDGKPREGEARSLDLAGYKGSKEGVGEVFHFNVEFWKEQLFAGMDPQRAAAALRDARFLVSNSEASAQRLTNKVRVPGGRRNFYSVSAKILQDAEDE